MPKDAAALQDLAEKSRRAELERALRLLARGEQAQVVLEALSRRLAGKLLHAPLSALAQPLP